MSIGLDARPQARQPFVHDRTQHEELGANHLLGVAHAA
jgi:hypothetical protein